MNLCSARAHRCGVGGLISECVRDGEPSTTGVAASGAPNERGLLERVKMHDLDAFERLYRLYQPRLARFLTNLVRRPQLVEEVLDDTMMVVWNTARKLQGDEQIVHLGIRDRLSQGAEGANAVAGSRSRTSTRT